MTILATLAIAYLAAGLVAAIRYHRRHRLTVAGQWALLILGWPFVLLVVYAADKEFNDV